jgi:hypothetical protein
LPNLLAPVALLLWIPIGLALFAVYRPPVAASATIIAASLLLPCGYAFKTKGLPELDRELIASLAALVGCLVFAPQRLRGRRPGQGIELLAAVVSLAAVGTTLTNQDAVGDAPALGAYDALTTAFREVLRFWLPFFLGRALFRSPSELRPLLAFLAAAGLVYSIPIFWEARMSPHLHFYLYGFSPAAFNDQVRSGGYRPMVFVGHGLALAMFALSATVASIGLTRLQPRFLGVRTSWVSAYLFGVLVICRSAAALVYGVVVAPLLLFLRVSAQARVILVVAFIVMAYPVLRSLDWFPTATLVDVARSFSDERSRSLEFRFVNEDALLERARERIWFGWGGWGRSTQLETIYGRPITDGFWIILLGQQGAVAYLAAFGLLLGPAIMASRRIGRMRPSQDGFLLATTGWIVVLNTVDLLPNGFLTARAIFVSGALAGAVQGSRAVAARSKPPEAAYKRDVLRTSSLLAEGRRRRVSGPANALRDAEQHRRPHDEHG